jgi:pimeloyl-ACP methyl ester carboxylesterase
MTLLRRRIQAAANGQVRHETILLVHGWPDSWRSWQRVLPLFDSRFHVIAVDQLGFGASSKPEKASYSTEMFAANLHSFISGLKLDNVFLVGHGLGSFNAWLYAAKVSVPGTHSVLITRHPAYYCLLPNAAPKQTCGVGYIGFCGDH